MGWTQFAAIIPALVCASLACAEPKTWQLGSSGNWNESKNSPASAPAPNPVLDKVRQFYDAHNYDGAHDLLLDWLKANPKAPDRDRGLYLMASIYYAQGKRLEAFYEGDELLDNYPESKLFFTTLEFQYHIADDYLSGLREKFLLLPIISMEDSAIEMMYRIQERSPGSPLAEKALTRTADYYYQASQFDFAADAYGALIRLYPRSTTIPRARLRQAYSNFAQFRGPRYDATPLLDARAQFSDVKARYPEMAREEGVPQFIDRIDEQLATKIYVDADYYARTGHPQGAVYLYRVLVQRYPNSKEAQVAKRAMEAMPASALAAPPPPGTGVQLSTSRPSGEVKQ